MIRLPRAVGTCCVVAAVSIAAAPLVGPPAGAQNSYVQTNLVSDIPGLARFTDPLLVNPWGISLSATSPFWVANNHTGTSTLYNTQGVKQGLVVHIPAPGGGTGAPTGTVFNGTGAFAPLNGPSPLFLFATEDGTIAGWHPSTGTTAPILIDNSGAGAIYKGLALAGTGSSARLYAANFHAGTVDVWDANLGQVFGGFLDPTLPAGFAPFNVQNLGGNIFVTYAMQDAAKVDEVAGPGLGYVDVFNPAGAFLSRLISQGPLNAPWGLALAPAGWGAFGGDLLVGNFGDGMINAFNPLTGAFLGALHNAGGTPLSIDGLWALQFGNGGNGGNPNLLYFTAGLDDETHGLFGSLTATPEPTSCLLVASGVALIVGYRRKVRG
jgi:uncharacterized protein (TIGR03118 family)